MSQTHTYTLVVPKPSLNPQTVLFTFSRHSTHIHKKHRKKRENMQYTELCNNCVSYEISIQAVTPYNHHNHNNHIHTKKTHLFLFAYIHNHQWALKISVSTDMRRGNCTPSAGHWSVAETHIYMYRDKWGTCSHSHLWTMSSHQSTYYASWRTYRLHPKRL